MADTHGGMLTRRKVPNADFGRLLASYDVVILCAREPEVPGRLAGAFLEPSVVK